jgi:transaldolase
MPEKTLLAFAGHGTVNGAMCTDGGSAEIVLAEFNREGLDDEALAADLQREGTESFAKSWRDLMLRIGSKSGRPTEIRQA